MKKNIFNFNVGELIKILKEYPEDMPVVVDGYKSGFENFYHPSKVIVEHLPENMYDDGEFQRCENGITVLALSREFRDD
jgi:hypothetical protein